MFDIEKSSSFLKDVKLRKHNKTKIKINKNIKFNIKAN